MKIIEFLNSKKLEEYKGAYINYTILDETLDNLYRLEREKAYGFNFTIIEPCNSGNDKYIVVPSISNQDFKDEYLSFLNLLQCELIRIDSFTQFLIEDLANDLVIVKSDILKLHHKGQQMFTNEWWNLSLSSWFNILALREDKEWEQLRKIEQKLLLIKENIIPLNKFALSKILKKKKNLVEKSYYSHLLLEVETGNDILPPPSYFPVMGKRNRMNFDFSCSELSDDTLDDSNVEPYNRIRCDLAESSDRSCLYLPRSCTSSYSDLTLNKSKSSRYSCSSSITSSSSYSSSFSNDEIIKGIGFWKSAPTQIVDLLNQVKFCRKYKSCFRARDRLIREVPY